MRGNIHNYIEFALDYAGAGLFEEAILLLNDEIKSGVANPMAFYFCGWFEAQRSNKEIAQQLFKKAEQMNSDLCFAYRLEAISALSCAMSFLPDAAKAPYHLGNLWYDKKQYTEAIECWENSRNLNTDYPTVHRNLALAYFNKLNDAERAVTELEKAFELDTQDARILMELDQLYKRLTYPHKDRLELLEKYPELVNFRDDLYLEKCTLYNQMGDYNKALNFIEKKKFHPWEGGEGKVTGQYLFSLVELAKEAVISSDYKKAIELLQRTEKYPDTLGEGKLYGTQENDIHYWLGVAHKGLGEQDRAVYYWEKTSEGLTEPSAAIFYNDQQPDKIFYQGLALLKLGKSEEATQRFNNLIGYGKQHLSDDVKIDYFAVSLPDLLIWEDNLNSRNEIDCRYLIALGALGKNEIFEAKKEFDQILKMDVNHQAAQIHLKMLRQIG